MVVPLTGARIVQRFPKCKQRCRTFHAREDRLTETLYGNSQPYAYRTQPYTVQGTSAAVRTVSPPYRGDRTVQRRPALGRLLTENTLHLVECLLAGA